MANPWTLYDRLIDPIPEDLTVTAASVGPKWCRITSCEGGAGMAFSMPASTRPALHENGEFVGARLRDVAQLVKSWNLAEAGMGMAAVNAWHSLPARARANGFAPCADNNWAKSFHPYREATRGRKVAVIGHFPFAPAALSEAGELFVFERNPVEGDYPDSASEYLLPECDYVFISGSAFVNKTAPRLIELSRNAHTVLVGPSVPLNPVLFDHGVDTITGFVSPNPQQLDRALAGVTMKGMFAAGYRVHQHRPA